MNKKIRSIICALILSCTTSSLFAVEEYVANIYKEIDRIFAEKSEEALNSVLKTNSKDKYYYLIESYTEKKIRRLIINDDYEFAMEAIVIVIENNLDNEHAVEMYSSIADAYEVQQQYEIKLQKQKEYELARLEKEKEKQRANVNKNYIASTTAGNTSQVYVSGKDTQLLSYAWKTRIGLVDFSMLTESKNKLSTFNYGVNADFTYKYSRYNHVVGFDVLFGVRFLSIGNAEGQVPLMMNASLVPKVAIKSFNKNLFFQTGAGFMYNAPLGTANLASNVTKVFLTPIVGIQMEKIDLGPLSIGMGVQYYPGHFFYDNINFAMGANLNVSVPFAETDKFKTSINFGLKDDFFLTAGGIENKACVILAIGAENVIK